jgi:MoaA/NifB/PqqE/SkfB family radical SAM enzyme
MAEKQIFNKAYVEITNVCNLNCSFCKGTDRKKQFMSVEDFEIVATKVRKVTSYIYLHLLGEPTLHPNLREILSVCQKLDFKVIITTNGTLLDKVRDILIDSSSLHKVNISLHAFEANDLAVPFEKYLHDCFAFGKAAEGAKIVVFRLWNNGGAEELNGQILAELENFFPKIRNGIT